MLHGVYPFFLKRAFGSISPIILKGLRKCAFLCKYDNYCCLDPLKILDLSIFLISLALSGFYCGILTIG